MKRVLVILVVLIIVAAAYYFFFPRSGKKHPKGPEPVPLAVSKHSPAFNQSVQSILDAYYNVSEALVNWDVPAVDKHTNELNTALDNFKVEELKVDTVIYQSALDPLATAKATVTTMLGQPSIDQKRVSFNTLSDYLRLLFIVVKYDANKLYWQECPMAFGEDQAGYWLSKTDAVRNPYLGTKHPEYKAGMLECGGPKDTINFMVPDTTGR
ncbi:MAG: DUF3347 domain-containing protein [Chitinophagaceae bacterium]